MEFFKLLGKESLPNTCLIVAMSVIAGIAGGVIVPLVIAAAEQSAAGKPDMRYVFVLPLIAALLIISKRIAQTQTARLTEQALSRLFVQIANVIRHADLAEFEKLPRAEVYVNLTNAQTIANAAVKSIEVVQHAITMKICWLYIFVYVSRPAGLILLAAFLFAILVSTLFQKLLKPLIHQETESETALFTVFQDMLHGLKELKLNRRKSADVFENYLAPMIGTAKAIRSRILFYFSEEALFVFVCFYLVMGANAFFFSSVPHDVLLKILTVTLYLTTPIMIVHDAVPYIAGGSVALRRLLRLANDLTHDREISETLYSPAQETIKTVQEIALENVSFAYHDDRNTPGFSVGPINLKITGGEIVFLVGGNGSGKSTLLKLMSGLYAPAFGQLSVNGRLMNMANHRYLFASVFSDFHLFERFYGVENVDEERVNVLLRRMELSHATHWRDGQFSTLALSAGQRKRLALIAALLDDKPVYIFDEWAAEQAPHFRRYFYEELLPSLKAQGKTIIAATHDDRYFHAADRVIKMEYGNIVEESSREERGKTIHLFNISPTDIPPQPRQTSKAAPAPIANETDWEKVYEEQFVQLWSFIKGLFTEMFAPILRIAGLVSVCDTVLVILLYASVTTAPTKRLFALFLMTMIVYMFAYRRFYRRLFELVEERIAGVRRTIIERVRTMEMFDFERLGVEPIYTALTFDVRAIADVSHLLSSTIHAGIYTVAILFYVAFLSPSAFLLIVFTIALAGYLYAENQVRIRQIIYQVRAQEHHLFEALNHLLDGFKELKSNDRKSDDFFHRCFTRQASLLKDLKIQAARLFINNYTFSCLLWETLILAIVLILPVVGIFSGDRLLTLVGIVLFLPISLLIEHFPRLIVASISMQRLRQFQQDLDQLEQESFESVPAAVEFRELAYCDISFSYPDGGMRAFMLGPLSFSVNAGEIVFITGGNGSGKTTLLKLLTGLYHADSGRILLNGSDVSVAPQRELFAPIFSDFHLFDRLYGLTDIREQEVNALLKMLELDQHVRFQKQQFSTLDLSTGQKKRLALAAAMLDTKPIYLFDEWAADQDPHFRRYFYEELLPRLKAQGKTIIAVTHDDRYFHAADRIVTLDDGKFTGRDDILS